MPYLYILECADGSYYTGSAINIDDELIKHQNGGTKYTKNKLPVELVFVHEFEDINKAFYYEKLLKGWSHNKKIALVERKISDAFLDL